MTKERLKLTKKNGFTLMEVMIAITVLLVGVTGLTALTHYVATNVNVSVNQLIAANLAQEGVEAIRNRREHLKDDKWAGWYGASGVGDEYRVEIDMSAPYDSPFTIEPRASKLPENFFPLYYDSSSGAYNHIGVGEKTIFNRKITVNTLSSTEKQVITEVWWTERGQTRSFLIENRLHFWWYE